VVGLWTSLAVDRRGVVVRPLDDRSVEETIRARRRGGEPSCWAVNRRRRASPVVGRPDCGPGFPAAPIPKHHRAAVKMPNRSCGATGSGFHGHGEIAAGPQTLQGIRFAATACFNESK
jgi:hypothetical protein